jgi:hypothetical protein
LLRVDDEMESVVAGGTGVDPAKDWLRFLTDGRQEGEIRDVGP